MIVNAVLLLRIGTGPNMHPGNIRYRHIVRKYVLQYLDQQRQQEGNEDDDSDDISNQSIREFAYSVVSEIREKNGRFLQASKGDFVEVRIAASVLKVVHALRHQIKLERKALKKQQQKKRNDASSSSFLVQSALCGGRTRLQTDSEIRRLSLGGSSIPGSSSLFSLPPANNLRESAEVTKTKVGVPTPTGGATSSLLSGVARRRLPEVTKTNVGVPTPMGGATSSLLSGVARRRLLSKEIESLLFPPPLSTHQLLLDIGSRRRQHELHLAQIAFGLSSTSGTNSTFLAPSSTAPSSHISLLLRGLLDKK